MTGTVIKNYSDPFVVFSLMALRGNSESKCNRLLNPKGDQSRSMVYCKLFEDSGLKPNEFSVNCEQCHDYHLVHNVEAQKILYVTENPELANGARSHSGAPDDPSFRDLLIANDISPSQTVHIEFINVRDGGAFADT